MLNPKPQALPQNPTRNSKPYTLNPASSAGVLQRAAGGVFPKGVRGSRGNSTCVRARAPAPHYPPVRPPCSCAPFSPARSCLSLPNRRFTPKEIAGNKQALPLTTQRPRARLTARLHPISISSPLPVCLLLFPAGVESCLLGTRIDDRCARLLLAEDPVLVDARVRPLPKGTNVLNHPEVNTLFIGIHTLCLRPESGTNVLRRG